MPSHVSGGDSTLSTLTRVEWSSDEECDARSYTDTHQTRSSLYQPVVVQEFSYSLHLTFVHEF